MGTLSKNFDRSEFRCRCGVCDFDTVDYELIIVLEQLREHFNTVIRINSGCRCEARNRALLGEGFNPANKSQHLYGKAADIVVRGVTADDVYNYLDNRYPTRYGIGKYPDRVHIDVRSQKARW